MDVIWVNDKQEDMTSTHITSNPNGTAHANNLLDSKERLGILRSRKGAVRQRADGHNRDGVGLVLAQDSEHLFVGGIQGGRE